MIELLLLCNIQHLYKSIKIVFSQFQHRPQFKALNEGSIVSLLEKLALSVLDLT